MRNYLAAECYKLFRRKYFYIALLTGLIGEGVLLWGLRLTLSWGNGNISFASTAILIGMLLSVGMYATMLTGDMVFSEQYKHLTLKNEVSYGLSRDRIYFGKLLVSTLAALIAGMVMVGFYVGMCWLLYPHGAADGYALSMVGYYLAGALPLWLAAQAVVLACYFNVRSSTGAGFLSIGLLAILPSVFQGLGLLFHPVFETIRELTPSFMLDNLRNMVFDWNYMGQCWASGLVWCVGATAVGLLLFRRKEIR